MSSFVIDDYRLDITPQGNYPVVYLSQFEDGRDIRFYMLNRGRTFTIPTGISAFVSGLKSNGGYYEHTCTIDGNYIIVHVEADMTDASGRGLANIKLTNQSGDTVISAKFVVNVQESVSDSGIEVPTVAETIFQQLLDEIRQQAATISVNVTQLNNNVTQFIADVSNEVETFESGVDSDIAALDARMDTFIAQHSGVSANSTRITETTLWSGKVYTSGDMIYAEEPVTDYDYIDVYYNFAGNSAIQRFTPDVLIGSGGGVIRSANLTNGEAADNMPLAVFEIVISTIAGDGTETQNFMIDFTHWTWNGQPQSASVQTLGGNVNARYVYKLVGIKHDAVTASKDTELTDVRVGVDGTVYTTAGAAVRTQLSDIVSRFDTLTDDISGIEAELKTTSPYNIVWQQGGINSSGTAVSRTNRIRSDYITIENDSIFVEIPPGLKYAIHAYNASKTRIGYIPNGSDIMTDRKATYKVSDSYDNAVYFRIWVAYTDDSDILPAEGSNVTVAPYESVIESLKSHVLKSVRILGVGNSYTRDSIRWLCKILKESGYEDVIVGHGYLGASTLAEQYASLDSSDSNHSAFEYWKYSNTKNAKKTSGKTLDEILTDEPWDIVVFQQQSDESGQYASYVSSSFDINDFVTYISGKVSNADLKFALMMPWSHADGYTSTKFTEYYNSDPRAMLDAIKTVIPQVADHMSQCDYVVNAGEAIDLGRQNSYLNALGDQMLRTDKNHLYYGIPSYMVGLVYALTLCDVNLNNVMWYPTATDEGQTGITTSGYLAYLAKQCAFNASHYFM